MYRGAAQYTCQLLSLPAAFAVPSSSADMSDLLGAKGGGLAFGISSAFHHYDDEDFEMTVKHLQHDIVPAVLHGT